MYAGISDVIFYTKILHHLNKSFTLANLPSLKVGHDELERGRGGPDDELERGRGGPDGFHES